MAPVVVVAPVAAVTPVVDVPPGVAEPLAVPLCVGEPPQTSVSSDVGPPGVPSEVVVPVGIVTPEVVVPPLAVALPDEVVPPDIGVSPNDVVPVVVGAPVVVVSRGPVAPILDWTIRGAEEMAKPGITSN